MSFSKLVYEPRDALTHVLDTVVHRCPECNPGQRAAGDGAVRSGLTPTRHTLNTDTNGPPTRAWYREMESDKLRIPPDGDLTRQCALTPVGVKGKSTQHRSWDWCADAGV